MTIASEPSRPPALDLKVLELLVSRLCHDMVSPIGAVNNGVELVEELGDEMGAEATQLIAHSGRQAAARLQCFRMAYGAAGSQSTVDVENLREIAAGWVAGSKASVDWRVGVADVPSTAPPGLAKLLLNAVVLAGEVLTHGGTITVAPSDSVPTGFAIAANGRTAVLSEEQGHALDGSSPIESLTPRTVHAYATGLFARYYGIEIGWRQPSPDLLVLKLAL